MKIWKKKKSFIFYWGNLQSQTKKSVTFSCKFTQSILKYPYKRSRHGGVTKVVTVVKLACTIVKDSYQISRHGESTKVAFQWNWLALLKPRPLKVSSLWGQGMLKEQRPGVSDMSHYIILGSTLINSGEKI